MKKSVLLITLFIVIGWVTMIEANAKLEKATFAGVCFWCMQPPFDAKAGVTSTVVGYSGGQKDNPTYEEVSGGRSGHLEAIEVTFDPKKVSFAELVDIFWRQIDPTQADGQFADRGHQYTSAIFYHDDEQKRIAELSKKNLSASGLFEKPIVTAILPAAKFWPAEEYHQKYYVKKTFHYKMYKQGSGREAFIENKWGKEPAKK